MPTKEDLTIFQGYRIKIYPTDEQKDCINRFIDLYRATYNLALEIQNNAYANENRHIQYFEMTNIFSNLRNTEKYKWLKELQVGTIRRAINDVQQSFEFFFNKLNKYPKFKSKKRSKKSFALRSERTHVSGNYIKAPGIGLIDAKNHPIPEGLSLYNPRIKFDGYDYWFCCCTRKDYIDMSDIPVSKPMGVDVGVRRIAVTSNEDYFYSSNTKKLEDKLKKQQKRLSKDYQFYIKESQRTRTKYEDVPKSKNHYKRLLAMHKTQSKITNKRFNDIHTTTKRIVDQNPSIIVIEDIKVREISSDPWMRKYNPTMMFYRTHEQIQYQAADREIKVIKAPKNYPSTRICSNCGFERGKLSSHIFTCPICGFKIDRDLNASYNLRNLALKSSDDEYEV